MKMDGCCTGNGKNTVNPFKSVDMFNIPCVGHTLQLSDLKSLELKEVSKTLGRLRKITGHFYRSPKASAKLHEKQLLLGAPIHKLLNDCVKK